MSSLINSILFEGQDRQRSPSIISTGLYPNIITYETLESNVRGFREALEGAGLRRDSVCCIALPNGPAFVAIFLAILSMEAVVAPLNPALKQDELAYSLSSLQAKVVIGPRGFQNNDTDLSQASKEQDCTLAECYWNGDDVGLNILRQNSTTSYPMAGLAKDADFVALALHTSGTTGKPKAVPLLQSNLSASTKNVIEAYDLQPSDRSMLIMPLFHIHGIVAGMLAPLVTGSCIIIPEKGLGPDFWRDFEDHQATWWTATPTHQKILLSFERPPSHVQPRFIRSCSSPLAPSLLQELENAFKAPVLEAYAMTENAHHIASHLLGQERRPGTVGSPCGTVSAKVIDDNDEEVRQGDVGEVVIKGPSVMPGYLDNPEANAKAFTASGHFRTGDQGSIDDLGHIRLTGRLKELINKGGEKISPNEIDKVVLEHEDIAEAVSFAAPDEMYGEEVAIALVMKPGKDVSATSLRQWLQGRISNFKIPQHVCIVEAIPKTATGKVQRTGLYKSVLSKEESGSAGSRDLKALWSEVLGIEQSSLSDKDSFFDLGGNSAQAIKLASKARSNGLNLNAAAVFTTPTLRDLKRQCTSIGSESKTQCTSSKEYKQLRAECAHACGVDTDAIDDIAPSTPLQRRLASLNRDLGLWVLSLTFSCQNVGLAELEQIVETIRSRNAVLRSRMVKLDDNIYNVVLQDQAIWETSSSLAKYLSLVKGARMLYGAPQVRYAYVQDLDEGPHLVITTTHAVQDIWTRNLIYEELKAGLKDLENIKKLPTPTSFCDFARYVEDIARTEAQQYWLNRLNGFDRWSFLDRNNDLQATGAGSVTRIVQPKGPTGVAEFGDIPLVHLAWCLTLNALSDEERIFFMTVSSGRLAGVAGVETMMGPTLTTVPICMDLSVTRNVGKALTSMRGMLYGSVPYEPMASDYVTQHFGTSQRETLLNCAEVPESPDLVIAGKNASLHYRAEKNKGLYGKMSVLTNMRVTKEGDNLRLQAVYERSGLSESMVHELLDLFAKSLREVSSADDDASLADLRNTVRSSAFAE